jgi:predicted DNA-binding transcriptional regulator AlpA
MVQEKTFPAPRRLGPKAIAWIETDIANWMLNRPSL